VDALNFFLHLDAYLEVIIQSFGMGTYILLFLLVFAETGLVVAPFLPGDSLLFTAGAFAAMGLLDVNLLIVSFSVGAIAGDSVNYAVGELLGQRIIKNKKIIKDKYLIKTKNFYEKHGALTIVAARFMPIIRTFAPFMAGTGEMRYGKFVLYNIIGAAAWVLSLTIGGYLLGDLAIVKQNFLLCVFAIIMLSIMPAIINFSRDTLSGWKNKKSISG